MGKEKSNTKICKACKEEINKKAKRCPRCGKKQGGKLKFIILGLIVIVGLCIFIGGDEGISKPDKVEYVKAADIEKIYTDTSKYVGKYVKISGRVFNIEKEDGTTYLQVWEDTENSDNNTFVEVKKELKVKNDDYVEIDGYISKVQTGRNAFGGEVSAPCVVCDDVKTISYIDAVAPTTKTVKVDKTVENNGFSLTLKKVEFSKKETRCYFTFKNNGSSDFTLNTYSVVAVQDKKQLEQGNNYEGNYEELSSDIKKGAESSGIIVFDKLKEDNFDVIMTGSDTKDYNSYEFKFEVNAK